MKKFYFYLWLYWAARVTLCTLFFASILSFGVVFYIYASQGYPELTKEVQNALFDIFSFWFAIAWSVSLLFVLFRSVKYIFNRCNNGYQFKLLSCDAKEIIEVIGYGDLLKVWRRWFMLLIWIVGALMVLSFVALHLSGIQSSFFEYFDIYTLYLYILAGGYLSFIFLGGRCKKIKVQKC